MRARAATLTIVSSAPAPSTQRGARRTCAHATRHCRRTRCRIIPERTSRRSEEHTSELQSQSNLVCRLLLEKKKNTDNNERVIHLSHLLATAGALTLDDD